MKRILLGRTTDSKEPFELELERNTSGSQNMNGLLLCQQGGGKTNLLMALIFGLHKAYMSSDSEYGALPIVFSPLFEFDKLRLPSARDNLPPEQEPEGLDVLSYTFQVAEPPVNSQAITIYFPFRDLTVEDIAGFAGFSEDKRILGFIQKLIEKLQKFNPGYGIDDFIKEVEEEKALKDALYYVFTKLRKSGLFDASYHEFDWYESLKERKPIIFNFGSINTRDMYSTLTGILLRKLWLLSYEYDSAVNKSLRIQNGAEEVLSEREQFLVDHFYIALIFEESHQIFWNTTSTQLISFPSHFAYKQISDLLGRKKGFKYNFLVTQRIMELYKYFRKQHHKLLLGYLLYEDDKEYMRTELRFPEEDIDIMCSLKKFSFTLVDVNEYKNHQSDSVTKIKIYRSPCGQPMQE